MTHEPECMSNTIQFAPCNCYGLRVAYQRGREDAAKSAERMLWSFDAASENMVFHTCAAARGDEPAVITFPAVDNLRDFTPLWADTPYGRIYFGEHLAAARAARGEASAP